MPKKSAKRQEAIRREKRNKRIIAALCAVVLVTVITVSLIVSINQQRGIRVYAVGNNTVTLYANGNFTANLPHGVVRSGTFSEVVADGITTVAFVQGGTTANGVINGNVLTIPDEWDDGHGHPRHYTLRP